MILRYAYFKEYKNQQCERERKTHVCINIWLRLFSVAGQRVRAPVNGLYTDLTSRVL